MVSSSACSVLPWLCLTFSIYLEVNDAKPRRLNYVNLLDDAAIRKLSYFVRVY